MKKLMIAVAGAAMVSGAFAAKTPTAVYYFRADLRTTQGAYHEADKAADGVRAGMDSTGKFWYDDQDLIDATERVYVDAAGTEYTVSAPDRTIKSIKWRDAVKDKYPNLKWKISDSYAGVPYPDFEDIAVDKKKGYAVINEDEYKLLKVDVVPEYPLPSAGKYCLELNWYNESKGICYREVGIEYISRDISLDLADCCATDPNRGFEFKDIADYMNPKMTPILSNKKDNAYNYEYGFINRFGSWKSADADVLEIYSQVINAPVELNSTLKVNGWLAGQGNVLVGTIPDANMNDGLRHYNVPLAINGMIVGYMGAPLCQDCCVTAPGSKVFTCLDGYELVENRWTAVFGTFSLTFKAYGSTWKD